MVFILSNHKKCPTVLKLNKRVQELAAERCMTILFLKISVIIETDETYIKYDYQQIPGADYYIAKYRGKADKKFKCTTHDEVR